MIREFGVLPDGAAVQEITLKKGGLEASVLTLGAIIRDLKVDGQSVVLGFEDLESYLQHSPFFGAVPGRCANRIAEGRMTVDGVGHRLDRNENDRHHLHGGSRGFFNRRNWQIEQSDKASVLLKLVSEDGDMGYPGRVEVAGPLHPDGLGRVAHESCPQLPIRPLRSIWCTAQLFQSRRQPDTILDHQLEIAAETYRPG
jgi:aldose 1-epimerase